MRWLRFWMAALILWWAAALSGFGQDLPDWLARNGKGKPPDFGVMDQNGFFNRTSGAMKRISDQLRKLEDEHGFRIFLVVEPVLISTTASELAEQLQLSWVPDGKGLVVVFESDSSSVGFGRDIGGALDAKEIDGRVPTHEVAAILLRARDETDVNLAPEAYIESLMDNLTTEFNGYFEKRSAPPPPGRTLRLAFVTTGALALLALGAIIVGALVRLPSMAGTKRFRFPRVDRPERLGAPCGGGNVTTRRFRPAGRF